MWEHLLNKHLASQFIAPNNCKRLEFFPHFVDGNTGTER